MKVLNFSMNNLSMMALILCIGFVVDDAIVMLENIVRHIEHGEDRLTAALNGSKEIGFTILTMTTSLAAVFIPILFMGGILGRLVREFAVTNTAAILAAGLLAVEPLAAADPPHAPPAASAVSAADFADAAPPAPELSELQRLREPAELAADRRARRQQLLQRHRPERRHRRAVCQCAPADA